MCEPCHLIYDLRCRRLHFWDGAVFCESSELARHFRLLPSATLRRRAFYERILNAHGEGVVFKNENCPYHDDARRSRSGWIKLKRSLEFDVLFPASNRDGKVPH